MTSPNPPAPVADSWLLDALDDGVLLIDPEWRLLFANLAAERLLRTRRDAVVGKVFGRDLPAPPQARMDVYRRVIESRTPEIIREVVLASPELEGRYFEGEVHPSPTGGIGVVFRDVTERRLAEKATARLGRILEGSRNEIHIFDAETLRFVLVSRGAKQNLGYSMQELRELTPLSIETEFTPAAFELLVKPLRTGKREHIVFETVHRRRDGSPYPVEVRLQLAHSEAPPVFIGLIADISERRLAQEQLEAQAIELEVLNEELGERTLELEEAVASRNRFYAAMSRWRAATAPSCVSPSTPATPPSSPTLATSGRSSST